MAITDYDPSNTVRGLKERGLRTGGLSNPRRAAQEELEEQEGIDVFQAGGFLRRDTMRAEVNQEAGQDKKLSRDANMAYREAIRRGDRLQAFQIRMMAKDEGIAFGGVSPAVGAEVRAAGNIGEFLTTQRKLQGGNAQAGAAGFMGSGLDAGAAGLETPDMDVLEDEEDELDDDAALQINLQQQEFINRLRQQNLLGQPPRQ